MVNFGSESDLVARLAYAMSDNHPRPIAFLTGAGLSVPSVPGVAATLQIVRKAFPIEEQLELDALLAKHKEAGEKYRQAFQFLAIRRPPAVSERILKLATLSAYERHGTDALELLSRAPELEADQLSWKIPPGRRRWVEYFRAFRRDCVVQCSPPTSTP